MAAKTIRIAGRAFDLVRRNTVERELYWTALLERGGLDSVVMQSGETVSEFGRRAHRSLVRSKVLFELIATQVTRPGDLWSAENNPAIARFLGQVSAPADIRKLEALFGRTIQELIEGETIVPWATEGLA